MKKNASTTNQNGNTLLGDGLLGPEEGTLLLEDIAVVVAVFIADGEVVVAPGCAAGDVGEVICIDMVVNTGADCRSQ
jgi:hypothetical protein